MIQQIASSPFIIGFLTGAGVLVIWSTLWICMLSLKNDKLREENNQLKDALHRWKMIHGTHRD